MKKKLLLLAIIFLLGVIGVAYLSTPKNGSSESIEVTITITTSYGVNLVQESKISVPFGTSALDALKKVAEVETIYGGGFVSSINGIASTYPEKTEDWFFYVNGFFAREGSGDYRLFDGDVIQWDYHGWESPHPPTAILGAYPRYLSNGYEGKASPTLILFEREYSVEAAEVKRHLGEKFGVKAVAIPAEEASEEERSKSNVIIVAGPGSDLVAELNEFHEEAGFYAFFDGNILVEVDHEYRLYRGYEKAGVIQITQNIWNPKGSMANENVVLLVSGTDHESVQAAVQTLIGDIPQYRHYFGLIVTEEGAFPTPRPPEASGR